MLDVAALVRGQKGEEALLRSLSTMGITADPQANTSLSPREIEAVNHLPDVV